MIKRSAGKFEIEADNPYPCWITIRFDGVEFRALIQHSDLKDLAFCVERTIAALRPVLGRYAHEVD